LKDLSLHVLDLAENALKAKATRIEIKIIEDSTKDLLIIEVKDNGKGIQKNIIPEVVKPEFTTWNPKGEGWGLTKLKDASKQAGGNLKIESELGKGTTITATFQLSHHLRKPLGDIAETISVLIITNPQIDFLYEYIKDKKKFSFNTRKLNLKRDSTSFLEIKKKINKGMKKLLEKR
jgi:anti-sigma regulatory factor (Ser/Thr protein kinase)